MQKSFFKAKKVNKERIRYFESLNMNVDADAFVQEF